MKQHTEEKEIQIYTDMLRDAIREHNEIAVQYWSIPSEDGTDYQGMIDDLPDADMDTVALLKWAVMQSMHGMDQENKEMRDFIESHRESCHSG